MLQVRANIRLQKPAASFPLTGAIRGAAMSAFNLTSRRRLLTGVSAAALPVAAISAGASLAEPADDPVFAAIAAHRRADAAHRAADKAESDACFAIRKKKGILGKPRVLVGYRKESGSLIPRAVAWTPTEGTVPLYAIDIKGIERNVPDYLNDPEMRLAWIFERKAELDRAKGRVDEQLAAQKSELEVLKLKHDIAYNEERRRARQLIETVPTTLAGLAAIMTYTRELGGFFELAVEWEDAFELTIERSVRTLAGLPAPQIEETA